MTYPIPDPPKPSRPAPGPGGQPPQPGPAAPGATPSATRPPASGAFPPSAQATASGTGEPICPTPGNRKHGHGPAIVAVIVAAVVVLGGGGFWLAARSSTHGAAAAGPSATATTSSKPPASGSASTSATPLAQAEPSHSPIQSAAPLFNTKPALGTPVSISAAIGTAYAGYTAYNLTDATHLIVSAHHAADGQGDDFLCVDLAAGHVDWTVPASKITGTAGATAADAETDGTGHEVVSAWAVTTSDPVPNAMSGTASFATLDPATGRVLSQHAGLKDGDLDEVDAGFLTVASGGTVTAYATTDLTKPLATGPYPKATVSTKNTVQTETTTGQYPVLYGGKLLIWTSNGYLDAATGAPATTTGPLPAKGTVAFKTANHLSTAAADGALYRCEDAAAAGPEPDMIAEKGDASDYTVSRWDPATGKALWKAPMRVTDCSPWSNGTVDAFMTTQGGIIALDHTSGNMIWTYPDAGLTSTYMEVVGDDLVIHNVEDTVIGAMSLKTGTVTWDTKTAGAIEDTASSGGVLYVATAKTLTGYQASDGHKLWRVKLPKGLGDDPSFFSADGALYLGAMIGQGAGGDFVQVTAP
jgi:hypothetical protein